MGFGDQGRGQGPGNGVALLQDCVPVCTTPSLPTVSRPHFLTVEGAQRTCCAGSGRLGLSPPGSGISGLSPWAGVLRFTSASGRSGGGGGRRGMCVTWTRGKWWLCVPTMRGLRQEDWPSKARELYNPSRPTPTSRLITMSRFSTIRDRSLSASRTGRQS